MHWFRFFKPAQVFLPYRSLCISLCSLRDKEGKYENEHVLMSLFAISNLAEILYYWIFLPKPVEIRPLNEPASRCGHARNYLLVMGFVAEDDALVSQWTS